MLIHWERLALLQSLLANPAKFHGLSRFCIANKITHDPRGCRISEHTAQQVFSSI